jgi:hypothetical protein
MFTVLKRESAQKAHLLRADFGKDGPSARVVPNCEPLVKDRSLFWIATNILKAPNGLRNLLALLVSGRKKET